MGLQFGIRRLLGIVALLAATASAVPSGNSHAALINLQGDVSAAPGTEVVLDITLSDIAGLAFGEFVALEFALSFDSSLLGSPAVQPGPWFAEVHPLDMLIDQVNATPGSGSVTAAFSKVFPAAIVEDLLLARVTLAVLPIVSGTATVSLTALALDELPSDWWASNALPSVDIVIAPPGPPVAVPEPPGIGLFAVAALFTLTGRWVAAASRLRRRPARQGTRLDV